MLNSVVYWITYEMDVACGLLCWITMIFINYLSMELLIKLPQFIPAMVNYEVHALLFI
jgi:hypothetical protein